MMTEKEFERIYNAMWSKLYSLVYSYFKDSTTAQEVTQDVFVNLWLKRESLQPNQDISAYLFRSVRNRIYDQFGKIHSKGQLEKNISPTISVHTENPEQQLDYKDVFDAVNKEIDRLPVMTKPVFG